MSIGQTHSSVWALTLSFADRTTTSTSLPTRLATSAVMSDRVSRGKTTNLHPIHCYITPLNLI